MFEGFFYALKIGILASNYALLNSKLRTNQDVQVCYSPKKSYQIELIAFIINLKLLNRL